MPVPKFPHPSSAGRLLLALVLLAAACSPAASLANTPVPAATATLVPSATASRPPTSTPVPATSTPEPAQTNLGTYMPEYMPFCDGVVLLADELDFSWPDVETIKKELKSLEYYHCAQPYRQVAEFYRENMLGNDYDWVEKLWVDRREGIRAQYYNTLLEGYLQVWFLPGDSTGKGSYLAVAYQNDAEHLDKLDQP